MSTYPRGLSSMIHRPVVVRPGRPMVRTTFQMAADILPPEGTDRDGVMAQARDCVLTWLQGKFPEQLPVGAASGDGFESDVHGQKAAAVSLPESGAWALRYAHPDMRVPGRTWTTEISLATNEQAIRVGLRLLCASLPGARDGIDLTRPGIVRDLARSLPLHDVRQLTNQAWRPNNRDDLLAPAGFSCRSAPPVACVSAYSSRSAIPPGEQ